MLKLWLQSFLICLPEIGIDPIISMLIIGLGLKILRGTCSKVQAPLNLPEPTPLQITLLVGVGCTCMKRKVLYIVYPSSLSFEWLSVDSWKMQSRWNLVRTHSSLLQKHLLVSSALYFPESSLKKCGVILTKVSRAKESGGGRWGGCNPQLFSSQVHFTSTNIWLVKWKEAWTV